MLNGAKSGGAMLNSGTFKEGVFKDKVLQENAVKEVRNMIPNENQEAINVSFNKIRISASPKVSVHAPVRLGLVFIIKVMLDLLLFLLIDDGFDFHLVANDMTRSAFFFD